LNDAGLVAIEKRFIDKKPNTRAAITAKGRHAVEEHWLRLEQLRASARDLTPQSGKPRR